MRDTAAPRAHSVVPAQGGGLPLARSRWRQRRSQPAGSSDEYAIRHNIDGGRLKVETRSQGGQAVVVVANTGHEIRPDEIGRLFEPFRRLEGDRTRSVRGSGLGLWIVRSVVEAHGGEVRSAPRPGGGLVVEVFLPSARRASP